MSLVWPGLFVHPGRPRDCRGQQGQGGARGGHMRGGRTRVAPARGTAGLPHTATPRDSPAGHVSAIVGVSIILSMSLRGFLCVPSFSPAPPVCGGAAWRPESVFGRTGAAPYPAAPPALALSPSAIRAPPLSEFCPALLWACRETGSGGAGPPLVRGRRRLERAVGLEARQGVH